MLDCDKATLRRQKVAPCFNEVTPLPPPTPTHICIYTKCVFKPIFNQPEAEKYFRRKKDEEKLKGIKMKLMFSEGIL